MALLFVVGCDGGGTAPLDAAAALDATADDAGLADTGVDVVPVPSSAIGVQLRWLLDLLNGPTAAITASAVTPHFSAAFLRAVPPAQLVAGLITLAKTDGPFALVAVDTETPDTLVVTLRSQRGLFYRFSLKLVQGTVLGGLVFTAVPDRDPALKNFAEIATRLAAVAPGARAYVGRIDQAGCTPLNSLRADQAMPLGSLFKIYVLGALATKIAAGQTAWSDSITVQDDLKSLPSGTLQNSPAGTTLSIEAAATAMISISDNTAADHLLHFAGRTQVEAIQGVMGHGAPALNVPFLSTRDLFQLKLSASSAERAAYLAASPEMRRRLLDDVYAKKPLPDLGVAVDWTTPREIETLEWFATPADICRGFAALKKQADTAEGAPLYAILSKNPGVTIDQSVFSYAGFKGGSEPGVVTLSWLLHRKDDGAWVNVTLGFADTMKPIDNTIAAYYGMALVLLAGR